MAKRITEKRLKEVKERVLHDGSILEKEAFQIGVSKEELVWQLERLYTGGRKNTQYKAVLKTSERNASKVPKEELDGYRILPKPEKKRQKRYDSIEPAEKAESKKEPDPVKELFSKKEKLKQKIAFNLSSLNEARRIVIIKEEQVKEAKKRLEEAQNKVLEAENEVAKASFLISKAEIKIQKAKEELQQVERDIQSRRVFLLDPWFSGELPEYGKFISTVAVLGCEEISPSEEYVLAPDFNDMIEAGFDLASEYQKALAFVALCQQYTLEGKDYILLSTDRRLSKLLAKYIG